MLDLATNPVSLGPIAPTSGTAVRLTVNIATSAKSPAGGWGNPNSEDDLWANKVELQSLVTNGGRIYIGTSNPVDKVGLTNVIKILEPGDAWPLYSNNALNRYHVGQYFVDVETTGSILLGFADVI